MTNTNRTAASTRILALIASGLTPVDALKAVCGAENVDRMIGELYDELRRKAVC